MFNVIIPAAGRGSRFALTGISRPKPLIFVNGKTLIEYSIDCIRPFLGEAVVITTDFADTKHNKMLSNLITDNSCCEIFVPGEANHYGATSSALYSKDYFEENNLLEDPLIVINCDQTLSWNHEDFLSFIKENDPDGALILHKSVDPRNSFAKVEGGIITEVIEKDPISDDALIGFHYWKKAKDFFYSAEKLKDRLDTTLHEVYISETYNFLIQDGKKILPYYFNPGEFIPLGIPEDIDSYVGNSEWRNQEL